MQNIQYFCKGLLHCFASISDQRKYNSSSNEYSEGCRLKATHYWILPNYVWNEKIVWLSSYETSAKYSLVSQNTKY